MVTANPTPATAPAAGDSPVAPRPRGPRRLRAALAVVVALVLVAVVGTAVATPVQDPTTPPSPDLRRPALLSLAGRVVPPGGELLPTEEPYVTGPAAESPTVIPPPPLRTGSGALYAVGDSVLLGTEPYLRSTLDGWDVRLDAKVSRGVPEGFELVRLNADRIGDVLIVVLGHNYGGGGRFGPWLESLLSEVDDVQRVVLVTVVEWSSAQPEVNRAIRNAPARHPNVVVADWAAVVAANPGFLRDHVHPNRSGAIALANLIAVMTGPAPSGDGRPTPRPRLLPIPPVGPSRSTTSTTTGSGGSTSTTTPTGGGTSSSSSSTHVAHDAQLSPSTTAPSTTSTPAEAGAGGGEAPTP